MNTEAFKAWCARGIRILDGATGTELRKRGLPIGVCAEVWNLEHPEALTDLQQQYVKAGSDVVLAPTFSANRVMLARHGMEDRVEELNAGLVALSRSIVGASALVAGDMTTTGDVLLPEDEAGYAERFDVYQQQAKALISAGVDLIAVETMMGLTECMAAVEAIRSVSNVAILVSLCVQADGKCYFDGSAEEAAEVLPSLGADAVGINCSAGPEQLISTIRMMKKSCEVPILAKPNAGMPIMQEDGSAVYPMGPEEFAVSMQKLKEAGATILGGCCGTTPAHIRLLAGLK